METLARVALVGLGVIVLVHWQDGKGANVRRWARYAFSGRGV